LHAFDASSMIYAWDNYPPQQFPPLWRWVGNEISDGRFVMPKVAFDEVKDNAPDCAQWLRDQDVDRIDVSNDIIHEAFRIKNLLGIQDDKYHPKGVGENDLLIIATAAIEGIDLVSNEGRQNQIPDVLAK